MAKNDERIERFFNNIKPMGFIAIGDGNSNVRLKVTCKTKVYTNTCSGVTKQYFVMGYIVTDVIGTIEVTYEILGDEYVLAIVQEIFY